MAIRISSTLTWLTFRFWLFFGVPTSSYFILLHPRKRSACRICLARSFRANFWSKSSKSVMVPSMMPRICDVTWMSLPAEKTTKEPWEKKVGKPEEKPKESRDAQQKYRHLTLALHLFPSSLACCPIYFHHFSPSFSAVGFWMFLDVSRLLHFIGPFFDLPAAFLPRQGQGGIYWRHGWIMGE